jgi:hypothetical protein
MLTAEPGVINTSHAAVIHEMGAAVHGGRAPAANPSA